jgi:hypothetical protein
MSWIAPFEGSQGTRSAVSVLDRASVSIESPRGWSNTSMIAARLRALLVVLLACSCSEESTPASASAAPAGPKYEPMSSKELVAPAQKGLVLGVATEKDVTAAFGAAEVVKDKALGGTAQVEYGEAKAMQIVLPAKDDVLGGEAWLVPDASGEPRLSRLAINVKTPGTCKWIDENIGKHEAAKKRPGSNRVFGKNGEYTAGNHDGTIPVGIECHTVTRDGVAQENLDVSLEPGGGRSMRVNKNP